MKKLMNKIPELKKQILETAASPSLGSYVWKYGAEPQMGYSFSSIHATAYSFIGYQTLYLACHWDPIYWNTACLIVNSASLENEESLDKSTDYTKMAKAIGDIRSRGIEVSLVNINESTYSFKPDIQNNRILFGMKGINKVGAQVIEQIIKNRPYSGIKDFMQKCPLNKTVMVSLIKAGAFDELDKEWAEKILKQEPRKAIMGYYISKIYGEKKRLTLQNFNGLLQKEMIPSELNFQKYVFNFNKFLKTYQKNGEYYELEEETLNFYEKYFSLDDLQVVNGKTVILQKDWNKQYQAVMGEARIWLKDNQELVLKKFNQILFKECWDKYAQGNISAWEMESLCFYYNPHELQNVNLKRYGIVSFDKLPVVPSVDYFFKRGGKQIPVYNTYKIIGTVIGKNDARSSVSLLTLTGVVNVKFTKDYFAMYNRQLSERQPDGSKKIIEKGWFVRGTKLMITGFRRDDFFQAKTYAKTPTHQIYKILNISNNGNMELIHDRLEG